ncbi:restriction endonuclease subunit S [Acinetobacter bereziniae]|nr:restriction endonuclease subunit S [Acinetobacter bereziniae]MCM8514042.1 restriction endonuclease subunit S [Acinetobacter bereziniae]
MTAPKLRFKDFDGDWCISPLKNLCKINQGLQIAIEDRFLENGENRFFYITNEFLREGAKKSYFIENPPISVRCKSEDILMTRTGNTGQVVTNVEGAFHNNFFKIDFDRKQIDKNFFVEFLRKNTTQHLILKYAGASTIPDLNHSDFYRIQMSITSIEEQTKIASFLSAVDEKISQLIQKHELLSQYKQGMMQKLFSQQIRFKADDGSEFGEWEIISIKDAVSFIKDGTHGTHLDDSSSDLFLLSAKNLQNGKILIDEKDRRINQKEFDSIYKNYKLKDGDILLSVVGTIGRVAIFKEHYESYAFQRSVAFMRFKKALAEFIYQLFLAKDFQNELLVRQVVSAQPGIYLGDLSKIEIKLPCLEEQTKIANFLSAIDQKIEVVAQQIEQAKQWKKGLLQQMFV